MRAECVGCVWVGCLCIHGVAVSPISKQGPLKKIACMIRRRQTYIPFAVPLIPIYMYVYVYIYILCTFFADLYGKAPRFRRISLSCMTPKPQTPSH